MDLPHRSIYRVLSEDILSEDIVSEVVEPLSSIFETGAECWVSVL